MIKYYCDRCGIEVPAVNEFIHTGEFIVEPGTSNMRKVKVTLYNQKVSSFELCANCYSKLEKFITNEDDEE